MQNCYVYVHEIGLPDYLDYIPDENCFGFDGSGVTEYEARDWCAMFNKYNSPRKRHAYYVVTEGNCNEEYCK